jgi:hypothetical protein
VHYNNPHTWDELKQSVHETAKSIEVSELKLVTHNPFNRLGSSRAEGNILSI